MSVRRSTPEEDSEEEEEEEEDSEVNYGAPQSRKRRFVIDYDSPGGDSGLEEATGAAAPPSAAAEAAAAMAAVISAHAHDKKTAISASEALFSLLKSGRTCAEVSAAARDAGAPDALARALVAHESDPLAVHRFCAASTPALELDAGGWAPHLAPAAGAVARALGAFAAEAGVVTAAMLWLERMMAHAPARESAAAAGLEANAVALMRTHVADALLSRYYSEARAV